MADTLIIDTHGHVMGPWYPMSSQFRTNADKMVEVLQRHNVGQIWLSHCDAFISDDTKYNRELYEQYVKPYPEELVGFCALNLYKGVEHCQDEVRRCVEDYGFKGIKIHSWLQAFGLHHPNMYEVMKLAEYYGIPVIFHDGTPPYADTSQVAALAEMFPKVSVILGHAGLYDSYRAAILAGQQMDNVYLCLVGNTIGSIKEMLQYVRHDRILYGSDYCCGNDMDFAGTLIKDRYDSLIEAAEGANIDDILFGNAKQLIK